MVAALVIGSAATAVATAPPSFAATCTTSSHCYALTLYGAANGGYAPTNASGGDLYVNCLSVGNQNSDFIDWEIWSDTNDNLGQGNYWVEEGMTAGTVYDSGGSHTGFQWFWADSRPGGGYHEHYIGGASTGTWTNVSFYWQGNANWNVYLGGSYVGQSTNNGANSWGGSAGAESTTTNATVNGFLNNYQYKDPNGGWHGVSPNLSFAGSSGWLTGYSTTGTSTGAYTNVTSGCGGGLAPATLNADGRYTGQRLSVADRAAPAGRKDQRSQR